MKAICQNKCGFEDEFEPTECGLDYYEAVGECPCGAPTVNEDGIPTTKLVTFSITESK